MAKSRKNGGEKAHRKKIQKRNKQIKSQRNAMQKLFDEAMRNQIESLKQQQELESGSTINTNEETVI